MSEVTIYSNPLCMCCTCCCGIFWLLIVILIPISFEYVNYNELAFSQNSISNKVDLTEVYEPGRYYVGPSVSMIRFPRQYQTESFAGSSALAVFNSEGQEINVEIHFQYRIRPEQLVNLMETYGTNYVTKVRTIAEATLKNSAIVYSIHEYVRNRTAITEAFNQNITIAMDGIFLDVEPYKLQLGEIQIPSSQVDKFMEDAVIKQNAQQSDFEQQATVVRETTAKEVAEIDANATYVTREAAARADRIIAEANAEAERILAVAYGDGWVEAMQGLGITDEEDQGEFLRLMGILDNPTSPQLIDTSVNTLLTINGGR